MASRVSSFLTLSRHQIYYLQLRVPERIRQNTHINQKLIRKSLGTRHRGTAIRLARKMAVQMGDVYDELFVINDRINSARMWRKHFSEEKGKQHADDWAAERLTTVLDLCRTNPFYIREFFHILDREEVDLIASYDPALLAKADRILANNPDSVILPIGSISPIESILQGIDHSTPQAQIASQSILHVATPANTSTSFANTHSQTELRSPIDTSEIPYLDELRDQFLQDKVDKDRSKKTINEATDRSGLFVDVMKFLNGGKCPRTNEITPAMMRDFASLIKRYPSHINKRGKLKGKPRIEQLKYLIKRSREELIDEGFELIAFRTVDLYYASAGDMIRYGERLAYTFNPKIILPITPINDSEDSAERIPFSQSELRSMFESDMYKGATHTHASRYWAPLIALYSGATEAEILQLYVNDIKRDEVHSIWYFDIKKSHRRQKTPDPKKLKNKKGRTRTIPIHNQLIKLGFLDFVKGRKEANCIRLFPEEKRNSQRDQYKNFSAWFNNTFKKMFAIVSTDEVLKDFHSFRHNASEQLVGNGFDIGLVNGVVGHKSRRRSETEKTYAPNGLYLEKKNEILQKLTYDINHDYPKRFVDKYTKGYQLT